MISKVLREGVVVNTKLSACNIWVQNIIYKVENHLVSIALLNEYLENIIMLGQPILLKYSSDQTEFLFEGEIVKITPDFPSNITINITSVRELKNARAFPRHDVYLGSHIQPFDSSDEYFAIIHNISLVGMAFFSKDNFEIDGKQLEISIYLPNRKIINAKGRINRRLPKTDFIDYGLQYTEMQEDSNNFLSSFFNFVEDEKTKLREEFINCVKRHL